MTMRTEDVIERLARGLEPVVPLRRPWRRAIVWLAATVVYLCVMAALLVSSAHFTITRLGIRLLLPQIAAVGVSLAAATAAFATVTPASSGRALAWPAAAVAAWLGLLLAGAVQEWQAPGLASLAPRREWACVGMIAMGAAIPAFAMIRMLRRGAPLSPRTTTALAVVAAASLANVAACISHPHTSSAVILLWHGATVAALVAFGAWSGHRALRWDRLRTLPDLPA